MTDCIEIVYLDAAIPLEVIEAMKGYLLCGNPADALMLSMVTGKSVKIPHLTIDDLFDSSLRVTFDVITDIRDRDGNIPKMIRIAKTDQFNGKMVPTNEAMRTPSILSTWSMNRWNFGLPTSDYTFTGWLLPSFAVQPALNIAPTTRQLPASVLLNPAKL
jgi:uncharacterized repeat protein (TIGR02543 family)